MTEKTQVLHSRSAYGTDKPHMSKEKTASCIFPCINYISQKDGQKQLFWSNTNQKGHFGIKKVIFGTGAGLGSVFIDGKGEYGMSQFTCGIVGENERELEAIKEAITTTKFREIMKASQFTMQLYNYKIIALFRKDFYKDFIND